MFCPQCRAEYRPGFLKCSDCDIPLVDELPADPIHPEPSSEIDHAELVVVRAYPTTIDAELAKTALDSVGIDSMIRSDDKAGLSSMMSLTRGVELLVRADDVGAAEDVLDVEGLDGGDREPPHGGSEGNS
jgi:hypothetical protein